MDKLYFKAMVKLATSQPDDIVVVEFEYEGRKYTLTVKDVCSHALDVIMHVETTAAHLTAILNDTWPNAEEVMNHHGWIRKEKNDSPTTTD